MELAGAFSDGVFVQNLGTAPVYIGYNPSVNDASFDGVCAAGGSYSSSKGKAVYAYASSDTPIVWNNDTGASADAGTQVTATVGGTVNVGNTVPVSAASALPVSAASALPVSGTVGVSGTVPVSASSALPVSAPSALPISAASTLPVSGSVGVTSQPQTVLQAGQNIGATPQHTYNHWLADYIFAPAPNASGTFNSGINFGIVDVSQYQTIIINCLQDTTTTNNADVIRILVDWFSPTGVRLDTENLVFWESGSGHAVIPVKGTHARFRYTLPGRNATGLTPQTQLRVNILFTTPALPEYFHTGPSVGGGVVAPGAVGITVNDLRADPSNGGTSDLAFTSAASGTSSATIWLSTYNRRVVGTFVNTVSGGTISGFQAFLYAYNYNSAAANDSPLRSLALANALDTLYFEAMFPKAPVYLVVKQSGTGGNSFSLGLNYEHF